MLVNYFNFALNWMYLSFGENISHLYDLSPKSISSKSTFLRIAEEFIFSIYRLIKLIYLYSI